jgi:ribosomal-protein-alanine acetyltransferase
MIGMFASSLELSKQQNIFPITPPDITEIIKIGELSSLSSWTYSDYLDEIQRKESVGFVYKNSIKSIKGNDEFESRDIFGFIISRLLNTQSHIHPQEYTEISECEILNIAVHPLFRAKGIGQKLFAATVNRCLSQKVESIWLEVRKNNVEAVNFYQKNGFEVIYTRKNYYHNPLEDALVMKAALTEKG